MVVGGRCYPYVLLLSSSISNDLIPHVPPQGSFISPMCVKNIKESKG